MAATAVALVFVAPAAASHRMPGIEKHGVAAMARTFEWPAAGTITTPFTSYHHGLDIGMLQSLTVIAAAGGKVESVGYVTGFEGYGNIVVVDVAPHVLTLYAHLSSYSVHPGERVRMGQVLGVAGCTGMCTGTHLHFEMRVNGVAVDPRYFLR
ncbi:MAG TPA: M23 family metallopeptidase [Gaiellaceae bacterium]|nr:M23 family metallopeptidase [Gaiellaceae bacterium]